jgi:NTE family protein
MKRVVLVLGGGGVKGMAHIGAWKAIQESGLGVAEIIGTSIGALVGACIGGGEGWETLAPRAVALNKQDIVTLNRWALLFNGIRQPSVFRGDMFRAYIDTVLPVRSFEELRIPVSMNAVDLETGQVEWFGAGGRTDASLGDAVYASCALPVFYPPAAIGSRLYVDGGVRDALPIGRAAERGAELVVAVDVAAGPVRDSKDTVSKGMIAVHHRVFDIMAYARKRETLESWSGPELVYVRPALDGMSTFDFTRTTYFLEEGYRAMRQALVDAGMMSPVTPKVAAQGS